MIDPTNPTPTADVPDMVAPIAPPVGQTVMQREHAEPSESRKALVTRWVADVKAAKAHWKPDFDRMRRNMKFAGGKQWPNQKNDDDRYRVNLVQRMLKVAVSSLYAKNPTVIYKRRPKLDFKVWDGKIETLLQAQQQVQQAAALATNPELLANPQMVAMAEAAAANAQAIIADFQQGMQRRQMIDRIGKTLVTCASYFIDESKPGFKSQMKQLVRRARTCGVGYVKVGFQREMDLTEKQAADLATMQERLAKIGQLSADLADGEADPNSAEAEELKLAIAALRSNPEQVTYEGITFDFPAATKIIPSISTTQLIGWVGSEWIAEEVMLSPDRIKQVYGVDVGKSYTAYRTVGGSPEGGETRRQSVDKQGSLACVYHVYDKRTGMELVLCEGYPDFLKEPGEPDITIEDFFPVFAISFNECEEEGRLFPDSDVENMTSPQKEFNRSKEAQRQHRIANRPLYVSPKGAFEEEEVKALTEYDAHEVIELNGLEKGRPASDLLCPVQKIGVDPNLYETQTVYQDMQRATGVGEANMGGSSNATATETSIAEQSRQGTLGLDGDDLDELLASLFRAAGQIMLEHLQEETVMQIAGPGAVWPTLSRQDILSELWLETKAGSSGRPNAAADAAKFERIYPLLVQVPGVSPEWLAKKAIQIADDDADLEEAFVEGLASITAMNQAAQPSTGNPATDPNQQGAEGGNKTARPGAQRDNGQPQFAGRSLSQ